MENSGEIVICPDCRRTIELTAQRAGGEFGKKRTHQMYATDLAWDVLISLKGETGSRTMDELIRLLIHEHQTVQQRRQMMGGSGAKYSLEPVMPDIRRTRQAGAVMHVNTLGMEETGKQNHGNNNDGTGNRKKERQKEKERDSGKDRNSRRRQ